MKGMARLLIICCMVIVTAAMLLLSFGGAGGAGATERSDAGDIAVIRQSLGLRPDADVRVVVIDGVNATDQGPDRTPEATPDISNATDSLNLTLTLAADARNDETRYRLRLGKHSNRGPGMFVRVYGADGTFEDRDPGPVRTYRGEVVDVATGELRGEVAGSIDTDGALRARLKVEGDELWIEPVDGRHVVYRASDIALDRPLVCGVAEEASRETEQTTGGSPVPPSSQSPDRHLRGFAGSPDRSGPTTETFDLHCANIGCDVDVEYFQHFVSVEEAQQRIEDIINIANIQYEHQVQITHRIALIVIRTEEPDPYSADPPGLNELIFEWTSTFADVDWHFVQYFTGKDLIGGFGVALINGICKESGRAFSLVEFTEGENLAIATHVTEHELGHNWGATHTSSGTMRAFTNFPQAANVSDFSTDQISAYRDTRPCLESCDTLTIVRTSLPFLDDFEGTVLNSDLWQHQQGVTVTSDAQTEPSGSQSVSISPSGSLTTSAIDGENFFAIDLSYAIQREDVSPQADSTLVVEYLTRSYNWVRISTHEAAPSDHFEHTTTRLFRAFTSSPDLRIRFRVTGTGGRWFLDDVTMTTILHDPCPEDCSNNDGLVNIDDITSAVFQAGNPSDNMSCDVAPSHADGSFGNDMVNIDDVIAILNAFGACE